jgi:hypothetical protein
MQFCAPHSTQELSNQEQSEKAVPASWELIMFDYGKKSIKNSTICQ